MRLALLAFPIALAFLICWILSRPPAGTRLDIPLDDTESTLSQRDADFPGR